MTALEGVLLVASPVIGDPRFDRTVVLVFSHDDDGAGGVVLNRPTDLPVAEHLPQWTPLVAPPTVVFVGGPVQPEVAIALGSEPGGGLWKPVVPGIGVIDLDGDPGSGQIRVFAGYSGWSEGQLEDEIAQGAWVVAEAHAADAFTEEPSTLWRRVLQRQRGIVRWLANHPPDPRLN